MIEISDITVGLIKSISLFKPETTLTVTFLLAMIFDMIFKKSKNIAGYIAITGLVITGITFCMFLLVGSANLIMIYLAIETMSISSYILAGYTKEVKRSSEASLKYVIFGAVSSGIMLYGISILFGLTGSLNLFEINQFLVTNKVANIPLLIAGLMILAGSIDWHSVIAVLSILTMTLGNIVAIWQTNLKRLLAYSSIAHAGYLLMAVSVLNDNGVSAVLIYFFFYMLMNLGAFFIIQLIANKLDSENIDDYIGLGYRSPVISVCLTIFLISLTGLPPTAGFIGKLYVFTSVINSGYLWLAVIGVINSVISLYYYAKIIRNMYLRDVESTKARLEYSPIVILIVLFLAIPTLVFGIYFTPIVEWANYSMNIFIVNY